MRFEVEIDLRAVEDVRTAKDYYESQQLGLGIRFEKSIAQLVSILQKNPFFQIRYDHIRCVPMNKFPFMIHFEVNEEEKRIRIIAVTHTSLNPDDFWKL
jgi:toxin ParE1/3/4